MHQHGFKIWPILILLTIALFFVNISLGSVYIPGDQIFAILSGGKAQNPAWAYILTDFRIPKAITATLVGMGLSISGLQMQTLFRNPLAEPFVLGISSGASLGVALLSAGEYKPRSSFHSHHAFRKLATGFFCRIRRFSRTYAHYDGFPAH